jgi:hypothetical protein
MIFEIFGLALAALEHRRQTAPLPGDLEDRLRTIVQQAWFRNVELLERRRITRLGFARPYLREAFHRNAARYARGYYRLHGAFPEGWHPVFRGHRVFFAATLGKVDVVEKPEFPDMTCLP